MKLCSEWSHPEDPLILMTALKIKGQIKTWKESGMFQEGSRCWLMKSNTSLMPTQTQPNINNKISKSTKIYVYSTPKKIDSYDSIKKIIIIQKLTKPSKWHNPHKINCHANNGPHICVYSVFTENIHLYSSSLWSSHQLEAENAGVTAFIMSSPFHFVRENMQFLNFAASFIQI